MDSEKNISKMVNVKVNTEDLIYEVEKRPAIWNTSSEEYSNKIERRDAWRDVIIKFIPEFENKSQAEKNEIAAVVQKKWKGIRSCYTRELSRKKKEKSRSSPSGRKEYVYFETLRFLETVSKQTANSMDESQDNENDVQEVTLQMPKETKETEKHRNQFRKRKNNDDNELLQVLKDKIRHKSQQPSSENDEDRMFLLSLVSELHKVPADRKLKLKSDIITAIAHAQQINQQWPQHLQYQTPHTCHPSHLQHILQSVQQSTFHGGHHHSVNSPLKSRSASVESTPAATPASSPAHSEASSPMSDHVSLE